MKKILRAIQWIDRRGKVDIHEIMVDLTLIGFIAITVIIIANLTT